MVAIIPMIIAFLVISSEANISNFICWYSCPPTLESIDDTQGAINITEAPYQVLIVKRNHRNGLYGSHCSGSIIDNHYVLTSAGCVHDDTGSEFHKRDLRVIIGASQASYKERLPFHAVLGIIIHPDYNPSNKSFDFAILVVKCRMVFDELENRRTCFDAQRVSLPRRQYKNFTLMATGYDKFNKNQTVGYLNRHQIPKSDSLVSGNKCIDPEIEKDRSMFCLNPMKVDSSNIKGNRGGPVIVKDENSTKWVQVGLISHHGIYSEEGYRVVCANIYQARGWLNSILH